MTSAATCASSSPVVRNGGYGFLRIGSPPRIANLVICSPHELQIPDDRARARHCLHFAGPTVFAAPGRRPVCAYPEARTPKLPVLHALSGKGNLVCVNTTDGQKQWSKNLPEDFGGRIPNWGYAESPLVDGDKLSCLVGGATGHGVVAFDKKTGKEIWKALTISGDPGYNSPVIFEVNGNPGEHLPENARGVLGEINAEVLERMTGYIRLILSRFENR